MLNILQTQNLQQCQELCLCDAPGLTVETVRAILMSLDRYIHNKLDLLKNRHFCYNA